MHSWILLYRDFKVWDESSGGLRKAECIDGLADTRIMDLHPIVAALITIMNSSIEYKSRPRAHTDPENVSTFYF